jgi:methylenetetrahydrofolate reductase (NADPH)
VDAGADFIVTQLFYDVDRFLQWLKKVRAKGQSSGLSSMLTSSFKMLGITVPVIPGIMPIQTYSSFLRLTKLCGTKVPGYVMEALAPISVRFTHSAHTTMMYNEFCSMTTN